MVQVNDQGSPKGGSGEPVGFAILVGWQFPNVVFSALVDKDHNNGEGNGRHTEMPEDGVSETETLAKGEEVGQKDNQKNFSCDREMEENI